VKTDAVSYVFAFFALVVLAAFQELIPAFGGCRPPLLLTAALYAAVRSEPLRAGFILLLAAFFEDALASFPILCSPIFFLAAGLLARHLVRHSAIWITAVIAPAAEIWYAFWGLYAADDPVLVRALAAAPLGALAAAALFPVLDALKRAAGVDEPHRGEST